MKWIADITRPKLMHLEIKHDKTAGYYLYIWENGKGIRDDLQDTLEITQRIALEDYQIPLDAWKQIE